MLLMTDVTRILNAIEQGDPSASDKLLPLVYEELRVLARQRLANEKPGQTLQATALVHEAYLRLVGKNNDQSWDNRGHFFAAAAEAMRRILVESARRKATEKHGGGQKRFHIDDIDVAFSEKTEEIVSVHEALDNLYTANPDAAAVVKLRYFTGFTIPEIAEMLGFSPRKTDQLWSYAKAWLLDAFCEQA